MALKSALIAVMEAAARKATRGLVRDFGEVENLQVSKKGPADFVSAADLRAQAILKRELGRVRPDIAFYGEEGPDVSGGTKTGDRARWLVDPLDGTTNFLHGLPHFAISIALERDGDLLAGLILDPIKDELFWAERGRGAYLNGRRLRVSARKLLSESLLATGIPFKGCVGHARFVAELGAIMANVAGVRRFGAASLDLAYVAAGRYEGFWERNLSPWDIAAGIVLVREAGGILSDLDGGQAMLSTGNILAANAELHKEILDRLSEAR
jgi:myo-inositol-1(or 4)-monophosphatase